MTPVALYAEMVRTAESLLNRQAAETVVLRVCPDIPFFLIPPFAELAPKKHVRKDDTAARVAGSCCCS